MSKQGLARGGARSNGVPNDHVASFAGLDRVDMIEERDLVAGGKGPAFVHDQRARVGIDLRHLDRCLRRVDRCQTHRQYTAQQPDDASDRQIDASRHDHERDSDGDDPEERRPSKRVLNISRLEKRIGVLCGGEATDDHEQPEDAEDLFVVAEKGE